MPDGGLTVRLVLERMRTVNQHSFLTHYDDGRLIKTRSFGEVAGRATRLAIALRRLGVEEGEAVAILCGNRPEYVEACLGVPAAGAVLQTVNGRMTVEQIDWTLQVSGARVMLVDSTYAEVGDELAGRHPELSVIGIGIGIGNGRATDYEDVVGVTDLGGSEQLPSLGEGQPAVLCFTTGTTGDPKGVVYSHRALVLHAIASPAHDLYDIGVRDRVLLAVPLFHVLGWNLPFICAITGSDMVLNSGRQSPEDITGILVGERISFSCGVPTVWAGVRDHAVKNGIPLDTLRRVLCGGSRVPASLSSDFTTRFGVELHPGWGMTETLTGATAMPSAHLRESSSPFVHSDSAGRINPLYEMRIVLESGEVAPWDGVSLGELQVRGPLVAARYLNPPSDSATHDGDWLRTGDRCAITSDGRLIIADRIKDVIKSGGEWISSAALEEAILTFSAVVDVAVVARPDERWGERPVAFIVTNIENADTEQLAGSLRTHLAELVPKWWLPEELVLIEALPRTSVGKTDKKALRRMV